jgi:hypothetical protein
MSKKGLAQWRNLFEGEKRSLQSRNLVSSRIRRQKGSFSFLPPVCIMSWVKASNHFIFFSLHSLFPSLSFIDHGKRLAGLGQSCDDDSLISPYSLEAMGGL